ncbi:laminin subunit alpha [Galendromus occidentalis]|uniref:Laminin subunit alpha-1 n=1 Tax=Galendromus occidentalis TaxID=34638 RepID=A0AAJ7WIL9_9ACAR|nr:laminin subunit alpha [Galendromus occidentalis]
MSPPLSRSTKYHDVKLTIHLGQDFHVAYVYIEMGISPRPGVWALERSVDDGKTYQAWQYFASDEAECRKYFGQDVEFKITRDDSVICDTSYSNILPFQGGEIYVPLAVGRPSSENFFTSESLQSWTRATNIRLHLMRTKTLSADVASVDNQDPTVTRRYFYSIRHIDIGGRCVCNGHASNCDPSPDQKLVCSCRHNTDGDRCERCAGLFNQKKWLPASIENPNECEKCNCHEHAHTCRYNATVEELGLSKNINGQYIGGGVCIDCMHNTDGINCEKCKPKYYRLQGKYLTDEDVCGRCPCEFEGRDRQRYSGECDDLTARCKCDPMYSEPLCDRCSDGHYGYPDCRPCDCFQNGTIGGICENNGEPCPCKENFGGKFCKQCARGFYEHPSCKPCSCNRQHSLDPDVCDFESGKCQCAPGFGGRQCDSCEVGFYNYPDCQSCNCHQSGVEKEVCNAITGQCFCKPGFTGDRCETCADGFFGHNCTACNCSPKGSAQDICNGRGRCKCKLGWTGDKCEKCAAGYYWKENLQTCEPCLCDPYGAEGESCDAEGRCICKPNFQPGPKHRCDTCATEHYLYPLCEKCNCHPGGSISGSRKCETGAETRCTCKERVRGRKCDACKPLFTRLSLSKEGCEECFCDAAGTHSAILACNPKDGQCPCKMNREGRGCSHCADGTHKRKADNLFGCEGCECNPAGSWRTTCDGRDGCKCRALISGEKCDRTFSDSYVPTLHQFKYEVEDFRTPTRNVVRQGSDEEAFPNYSWMGYATFSNLQPVVIVDVNIKKNSMHHVVLRYTNPSGIAQDIVFTMIPGGEDGVVKKFKAKLPPTTQPSFIRLEPFEEFEDNLSAGPWVIEMQSMNVSIDYLVTIPREYLSATALKEHINRPCRLGENKICKKYAYPPFGRSSETLAGTRVSNTKSISKEIEGVNNLAAVLNPSYPTSFTLTGLEMASAIIVEYTSKKRTVDDFRANGSVSTVEVVFEADQFSHRGKMVLPYCRYTFLCRSVITDVEGRVFETPDLFGKTTTRNLKFTWESNDPDDEVYLYRVATVPKSEYSHRLLNLSAVCIQDEDICHGLKYTNIGKKIPFAQSREVVELDPRIEDRSTKVVELSPARTQSIIIDGDITDTVGPSYFLIHYYQPDFQGFEADVKIDHNGQVQEGKVFLDSCASKTGCRARVYIHNQRRALAMKINGRFSVEVSLPIRKEDEDMMIAKHQNRTFDHHSLGPYGKTWLEHVIVTPTSSSKDLSPLPYDTSQKFIERCIDTNSYYLDPSNLSEFCKSNLFRLTTAFNNGALRCQCDAKGSKGFDCESFGGQCPCRDNVIGRRCTDCKPGYFGFPVCKKCKCPENAVCDKVTGDCRCPPNVVGVNCDRCKPTFYDYNKDNGCEYCDCAVDGVKGGSLQCDIITGDCDCRENIGDRKCDRCKNGFYAYPHCKFCGCDQRGVRDEICDKNTAECKCKQNVGGAYCESCRPGHFYLEEQNPVGCTRCYCSGKISDCQSAPMQKTSIVDVLEWSLVFVNNATLNFESPEEHDYVDLSADQTSLLISENDLTLLDLDAVAYVKAPEAFLGNRLTSYGGNFSITVTSSVRGGEAFLDKLPDIVLLGDDTTLVHVADFDDVLPSNTVRLNVPIKETSFNHDPRTLRKIATDRFRFMNLLGNVQALFIRASYFKSPRNITLTISMDSAKLVDDIDEIEDRVRTVEQCNCPTGYTGLSCEHCAKGFYRQGSACTKCECNEHAQECDLLTGKCINCEHNTEGDHCEKCIDSFYGNATNKTPNDCRICPCPLATKSNNFAISCEVDVVDRMIHCVCPEGYTGPRCDVCDVGYGGQPLVEGKSCEKCFCHNNTDLSVEGNCDKLTAHCLNCKYNTAGKNCEKCIDWFWGDVPNGQKCADCECYKDGSERCDQATGKCICKPNVIGLKCDKCAPQHWDLASRNGCKACECAEGAENKSCDPITGACTCKPGVAPPKCEKCAQGFWNLTSAGCQPCKCVVSHAMGMSCDQETGQCVCLPGVIGENCERCRERDVFVTGEGCLTCDSCHHELLDSTDVLSAGAYLLEAETNEINLAVLNSRALKHYGNETDNLRAALDRYKTLSTSNSNDKIDDEFSDLGVKNVDLVQRIEKMISENGELMDDVPANDIAYKQIQALQTRVKNSLKKLRDYSANLGNQMSNNIPQLEAEARAHKNLVDEISDEVEGQLLDTNTFMNAVSLYTLKKSEKSIYLIMKIQEVELQQEKLTNLSKLLNKAQEKRSQVAETIRQVNQKIADLKDTNMIRNLIAQSASSKEAIEDLIRRFDGSVREIETLSKNMTEMNAQILQLSSSTTAKQAELRAAKGQLSAQERELEETVSEAVRHKNSLVESVEQAKLKLSKEGDESHRTMEAANSYTNLKTSVEESEKSVDDAHGASAVVEELKLKVNKSVLAGEELQQETISLFDAIQEDLKTAIKPTQAALDEAEARVNDSLYRDLAKYDFSPVGSNGVEFKGIDRLQDRARSASDRTNQVIGQLKNGTGEAGSLITVLKSIKDTDDEISTTEREMKDKPLAWRLKTLEMRSQTGATMQERLALNLERLREKILVTRGIANSIAVGLELRGGPDSRLTYVKPSALKDIKAWMDIGMYVNTSQASGSILYIGPDESDDVDVDYQNRSRRQSSQDRNAIGEYLLIKLENWRVAVDFALDRSIVQHFVHDQELKPDSTYFINIKRVGTQIQISVDDNRKSFRLNPGFFVFRVDEDSPILIGHAPTEAKTVAFRGQITNVVINNVAIGLWEFKKRGLATPRGAKPQPADRTLQKIDEEWVRFGSDGYAVLKPTYMTTFGVGKSLSLTFKTHAPEGLLFVYDNATRDRYFILQIRNGRPEILFKFGDIAVGNFSVDEAVNTGNVTGLYVSISDEAILLQVDSSEGSRQNNFAIPREALNRAELQSLEGLASHYKIGGVPLSERKSFYPGMVRTSFEGCIKYFAMTSTPLTLRDIKNSFGITRGCRSEVVQKLSLLDDSAQSHKHLRLDNVDMVKLPTTFTFRFKTVKKDGLIFFARNGDPIDSQIIIGLHNGNLVVSTKPGDTYKAGAMLNLADNKWHYVVITLNKKKLSVAIDDGSPITPRPHQEGWKISAPFYFGGLDDETSGKVHENGQYVQRQFSGCLADFTIDNKEINFGLGNNVGATLSSCKAVIQENKKRESDLLREESDPQCVLKYGPGLPYNLTSGSDAAFRFGSMLYTRSETVLDASEKNKLRYDSVIELDFRLGPYFEDGTLFLASSATVNQTMDYVLIYMSGGAVFATFELSGGPLTVTMPGRLYNDGKYHQLKFERHAQQGAIYVDGEKGTEAKSRAQHLDSVDKVFFGGIPEEHSNFFAAKQPQARKESFLSFPGCIKDIRVNGNGIVPTDSFDRVLPCDSGQRIEDGTYFGYSSGKHLHVSMYNNFKITYTTRVSLRIKARRATGLLFFTQDSGRRNHLALYLRNGTVVAQLKFDNFIVKAEVSRSLICDGEWHYVMLTLESVVMNLDVDDHVESATEENWIPFPQEISDGPIHLGGLPKGVREPTLETSTSFGGCIKDFFIGPSEGSSANSVNPLPPKVNIASVAKNLVGEIYLSSCYSN